MKNAIRRLRLDLLKGSRTMIIKAVLFTAVFTVVLSSTLIKNLSVAFEKYMTTEMEMYLYLQNSFQEATVRETEERYLKEINYLEERFALENSDYYRKTAMNSPFHVIGMKEDGTSVVYYKESNLDYKRTLKQEMEQYYQTGDPSVFSGRMGSIRSVRSQRYATERDYLGKIRSAILTGRAFTEEEMNTGADVCIASTIMHYYGDDGSGGIMIAGSKLPVTIVIRTDEGPVFEKTIWLEIVGTHSRSDILVPEKTFDRLVAEAEKLIEEYSVESTYYDDYSNSFFTSNNYCSYLMESTERFEEIVDYLEAHRGETVNYYSNSSQFTGLISSVSSITNNFNTIMYISLILCAFVSITIVVLELFFRKKEVGLLLSMGERKNSIVLQLMMEQIICIALSLMLAMPLSNGISSSVATDIIRNNAFNEDKYLYKLFTYSGVTSNNVNDMNSSSQEAAQEMIELNYENKDKVMVIGYMVLIILANVAITGILVGKNNPKELMQAE